MIKTEQGIYCDVGGLIRKFCQSYGYEDWGKSVLQFAQPSFQELPSPTILMNYFEGEKYGWVSTKYRPDAQNAQNGYSEISYYRKLHIDLHFFKDPKELLNASVSRQNYMVDSDSNLRLFDSNTNTWNSVWISNSDPRLSVEKNPPTDLTPSPNSILEYISPLDIAQALRAWFLSDFGVSELNKLGYGIFDTSLIRDAVATTDEDVYTRFVNFTITLSRKETIVDKYDNFIKADDKEELTKGFTGKIHALTTTNKDIQNGNTD